MSTTDPAAATAAATTTTIPPPSPATLLSPLLPALTTAAVAREPASNVLPLLSPILRQRVQFLSASSPDPWLRLLCYDRARAAALQEVATSGELDPHPVSGEVEVDWASPADVETRFRRPDSETLQAFVALRELGLGFQLVWCPGDKEGGGDGWRVGEVTTVDKGAPSSSDAFAVFGGYTTAEEADASFRQGLKPQKQAAAAQKDDLLSAATAQTDDGDSDDGYWDRYDATPSRTPAQNISPAPGAVNGGSRGGGQATDEDDYYAQYDSVQPAMDNHDPDEEAAAAEIAPPMGLSNHLQQQQQQQQRHLDLPSPQDPSILHPRPESSASSNRGSDTVARLEEQAGRRGQSEFGVKQHVSRTVRSLWLLSRASGIERDEFERLVRTELDVIGMVGDDDY